MSTTAGSTATETHTRTRGSGFGQLQRLGKSLMLPIALLPAAGLLLRLGQPDMLGKYDAPVIGPFFDAMAAGGDAIFANLPLLFAIGVAIGFAKKADGSTALSAVAGYLVIAAVFKSMSPIVLEGMKDAKGEQLMINYSVFAGIIVGLITAWLFDRYHDIKLPTYLGFFGGRRFVPIVVSFTCLVLGFALSYFYPIFNAGLTGVGHFIGASGVIGAFLYGVVNRLLIPLGLHHIVNTYMWFLYGHYNGADGPVTGELSRFAAGDPHAGLLTSGFYPILMFGLPGAALAIIHTAKPAQKKVAVGIMSAAALTAFLTGITEPLEFAFMFIAWPLFLIHALLTGLALAIAYTLDIHLGFSFSAGLIDLLLYGTAPAAKNVPILIVMGLVFFVIYYALFRFVITKWNLRTPGRLPDEEFEAEQRANLTDDSVGDHDGALTGSRAEDLITAFGGRDNVRHVDACITRLRVEVADRGQVNKGRLKTLGAAGVVEVGNNVQAIFGTQAEGLKHEINDALAHRAGAPVAASAQTAPTTTAADDSAPASSARPTEVIAPVAGRTVALRDVPDPTFASEMVGAGLAIDPPREQVSVVAPVSGKLVRLLPHAFIVLSDSGVGVLTHLGLDTVQLQGRGFILRSTEGEQVRAGQPIVNYDVPTVEQQGRNPIVVVVAMDTKTDAISNAVDSSVSAESLLFTVN